MTIKEAAVFLKNNWCAYARYQKYKEDFRKFSEDHERKTQLLRKVHEEAFSSLRAKQKAFWSRIKLTDGAAADELDAWIENKNKEFQDKNAEDIETDAKEVLADIEQVANIYSRQLASILEARSREVIHEENVKLIYQRHLNKYKEKKAQMVEANEAQLKKIIDEAIEENSYTILKFNNTCWENILKAEKSTADDIRHVESKLSEEIRLAEERIAGCLKSVKVNKAKQRDQAAHRMALTRNTLERKNKMALDALEVRLCNYRMRVVVANANYRSSVEYVIRSHITKASYKCFCARKFLHEENKEEEEIAKFIAIKGRYIVRTRYPVIQKRARGVKVY